MSLYLEILKQKNDNQKEQDKKLESILKNANVTSKFWDNQIVKEASVLNNIFSVAKENFIEIKTNEAIESKQSLLKRVFSKKTVSKKSTLTSEYKNANEIYLSIMDMMKEWDNLSKEQQIQVFKNRFCEYDDIDFNLNQFFNYLRTDLKEKFTKLYGDNKDVSVENFFNNKLDFLKTERERDIEKQKSKKEENQQVC